MENGNEGNEITKNSDVLMIEGNINGITAKPDATTVFSKNHNINNVNANLVDANGNPVMNVEVDANGNPIANANVDANGNPIPEMHAITYDFVKGGTLVVNAGVHLTLTKFCGTEQEPIVNCIVHGRLTLPKGENTCVIKLYTTMQTGIIDLPYPVLGSETLYGPQTPEILKLANEFDNFNLLEEVSAEVASHVIDDTLLVGDAPVEIV